MKSGEMSGQEDNSTQISNNLDPSQRNILEIAEVNNEINKDRRKDPNVRAPKWLIHYETQNMYFPLKLRSFTFGKILEMHEIYRILNNDYIKHNFDGVADQRDKARVCTFVIIRQSIKLQIFFRALQKMRSESALKI